MCIPTSTCIRLPPLAGPLQGDLPSVNEKEDIHVHNICKVTSHIQAGLQDSALWYYIQATSCATFTLIHARCTHKSPPHSVPVSQSKYGVMLVSGLQPPLPPPPSPRKQHPCKNSLASGSRCRRAQMLLPHVGTKWQASCLEALHARTALAAPSSCTTLCMHRALHAPRSACTALCMHRAVCAKFNRPAACRTPAEEPS
eukprot:358247-Chlamydomonas_euryale.AAC.7